MLSSRAYAESLKSSLIGQISVGIPLFAGDRGEKRVCYSGSSTVVSNSFRIVTLLHSYDSSSGFSVANTRDVISQNIF